MFNLIHPGIALVIILIANYFNFALVGAVCISAFFAGREHAQAEYRWIERFGKRKRANMRWWNAFDPKVWDTHSWFWNLAVPIGIAFGFVLA